jgi:hypothetical protein
MEELLLGWKNFEPVVLFIRDEIAIPNIGENTIRDT